MHRRIDKFISDKLKETHFDYEPAHWSDMSTILDNESNNRSIGPWYWTIAVFVLLSFAVFLLNGISKQETNSGKEKFEQAAFKLDPSGNETEIVQLTPQLRNGLNKDNLSTKDKSRSSHEILKSDRTDQGSDALDILPVNTSKVEEKTGRDRIVRTAKIDKTGKITSADLSLEYSNNDDLQLLNLQQPQSNNWGVGVGWHVENSWGWSTGAFASLDYRFHRTFSINVRPGLTFRSNKSETPESLKGIGFSPGLNNFIGDVEQMESYAVDIPLSLQIHKQRHLLSLGGGVHYAFLQKVAVHENQLAGFNSFTNTNPVIFESSTNKNTWVQPGESFYPFAELYYSYLLTPSFELGGRSRFYMPDNLSMNNRLNFAAQLVWHIN